MTLGGSQEHMKRQISVSAQSELVQMQNSSHSESTLHVKPNVEQNLCFPSMYTNLTHNLEEETVCMHTRNQWLALKLAEGQDSVWWNQTVAQRNSDRVHTQPTEISGKNVRKIKYGIFFLTWP